MYKPGARARKRIEPTQLIQEVKRKNAIMLQRLQKCSEEYSH